MICNHYFKIMLKVVYLYKMLYFYCSSVSLSLLMYHDVENFTIEDFHVKIVNGISVFQLQHDFKVEICCFAY